MLVVKSIANLMKIVVLRDSTENYAQARKDGFVERTTVDLEDKIVKCRTCESSYQEICVYPERFFYLL